MVTRADYITRVYSLPQKFGNIAKAYVVQDEQLEQEGQLQVIDGNSKKKVMKHLFLIHWH